jgi:2-C-methyl-D-erythritol 2,4-cyclodiphosphate synthase
MDAFEARARRMFRIGTGYDIHRTAAGRPLVLGGVSIPSDRGLDGHSDADVVLHALCDALLGAAGLGDIGELFPDTEPRYCGVDSRRFVHEVLARVHDAGLRVQNADVTIIAERPRLAPHKPAIRDSLAQLLDIEPGCVGVKAATNEGLDALGRGEAIACWASVLLASEPANGG